MADFFSGLAAGLSHIPGELERARVRREASDRWERQFLIDQRRDQRAGETHGLKMQEGRDNLAWQGEMRARQRRAWTQEDRANVVRRLKSFGVGPDGVDPQFVNRLNMAIDLDPDFADDLEGHMAFSKGRNIVRFGEWTDPQSGEPHLYAIVRNGDKVGPMTDDGKRGSMPTMIPMSQLDSVLSGYLASSSPEGEFKGINVDGQLGLYHTGTGEYKLTGNKGGMKPKDFQTALNADRKSLTAHFNDFTDGEEAANRVDLISQAASLANDVYSRTGDGTLSLALFNALPSALVRGENGVWQYDRGKVDAILKQKGELSAAFGVPLGGGTAPAPSAADGLAPTGTGTSAADETMDRSRAPGIQDTGLGDPLTALAGEGGATEVPLNPVASDRGIAVPTLGSADIGQTEAWGIIDEAMSGGGGLGQTPEMTRIAELTQHLSTAPPSEANLPLIRERDQLVLAEHRRRQQATLRGAQTVTPTPAADHPIATIAAQFPNQPIAAQVVQLTNMINSSQPGTAPRAAAEQRRRQIMDQILQQYGSPEGFAASLRGGGAPQQAPGLGPANTHPGPRAAVYPAPVAPPVAIPQDAAPVAAPQAAAPAPAAAPAAPPPPGLAVPPPAVPPGTGRVPSLPGPELTPLGPPPPGLGGLRGDEMRIPSPASPVNPLPPAPEPASSDIRNIGTVLKVAKEAMPHAKGSDKLSKMIQRLNKLIAAHQDARGLMGPLGEADRFATLTGSLKSVQEGRHQKLGEIEEAVQEVIEEYGSVDAFVSAVEALMSSRVTSGAGLGNAG